MTTSGVTNLSVNRDQIIRRAARLCNAIAGGETPTAILTNDFSEALNAMVKEWQASGIHVWTQSEATLFVQPNQTTYTLGSGSTDHCTATYIATTLAADYAIGIAIISLTSTTGMSVGDNIGIVLNNGNIFWTTISLIVGVNVTIANALTDSVTALGSVWTYTSNIVRPLRIIAGRRYVWDGGVNTPMNPPMSRSDFRDLPLTTNTGPTTQFFYDPQIPAGILNIWPSPPDVSAAVKFTYMRPLQIYSVAGDTSDFPEEWINTLVFGLAYTMAPEFAVEPTQYAMIKEQLAYHIDISTGFDKEPESIYMGVSLDHR